MIENRVERLPIINVPSVQVVPIRPGDGDMEIFMGLRATKSHHLQWAPPGGKVDPGETDLAAGVRELREEAGESISQERLIYFKDMPTSLVPGEFEGRNVLIQNAVRVYLIDGRGLNLYNASPREHVEMRWWRFGDAINMHERILALRGTSENKNNVLGTMTQGTVKTVRWLMGR